MSKTLVIAEKPSVGRDLARVLPGPFAKQEGWLEGPDHVITWAVGHLVQLAEPDEYEAKFKRWRMPDLPIVPSKFKLVVRDERSRKQMSVVTSQLGREDVDMVVNACDAGREGELIFAYLFEKAKAKKPVQRLWLNSMTTAAMKSAFESLRPAEDYALLEQAARSRSEADWIVGMNATRAASIRLKSSFDGAVSLGRVQTPTLAIVARREEEIKAFVPEPYWLVDATFDAGPLDDEERVYEGRFHMGSKPRLATEAEALAIVEACQGKTGTITKLDKKEQRERAPMLYDLTSLQREANTRYGFSARRTLAAAQRLYEEHKALTYPRTNSRYLTTDMVEEIKPTAELVGGQKEYAKAAAYVTGLDVLPLARVVNNEKVTDHHAIIPTKAQHDVDRMGDDDKRVYDMVVRRFLAVFHAIDVMPRGAKVITLTGMPCSEYWPPLRNSHLGAMVIVRREGFSNDQWLLEGVNLLDLRYRAAGYFAADPSQLVRPNRCRDVLHRMIDQSLSALPREDFDYVWLIDVPPYDPALVAGMRPVWRGPGSILYQTH